MSNYMKIQCVIADKECLLKALKSLGLSFQEHENPTKLRGYQGDFRSDTAEIIVPKEELNRTFTAASNDLGFKWNSGTKTYLMICSSYDVSCKVHERILQSYAKEVLEKELKRENFVVEDVTGSKALTLRKQTKVKLIARKII